MGAASCNGVATLRGLERVLKEQIPPEAKLRMAAEVGSDLPLFLLGGAVVGAGRGEEVYAIPDLPPIACVVALPRVAVSTPKAFADWDEQFSSAARNGKLTLHGKSDTINEFHRAVFAALGSQNHAGLSSGVPAERRGDRAEALLLDLVRTGIENDFERVVFPQHPELRDIKRVLERQGAEFASLSGSGSAIFGLFKSKQAAEAAARHLQGDGIAAESTTTLDRKQYWERLFKE